MHCIVKPVLSTSLEYPFAKQKFDRHPASGYRKLSEANAGKAVDPKECKDLT